MSRFQDRKICLIYVKNVLGLQDLRKISFIGRLEQKQTLSQIFYNINRENSTSKT